eukprot:1579836-Amphidinium_carterae.2
MSSKESSSGEEQEHAGTDAVSCERGWSSTEGGGGWSASKLPSCEDALLDGLVGGWCVAGLVA